MIRHLTRGLALILFVALAAPATFAQGTPQTPPQQQPPQQQPTPQPQQQAQVDLSDGELDSFAEAYLDIEELQATYEQRLGAVEDPAQAQQIQQEFNVEAQETLESSDLGPERYDEIIRAAQTDPALAEQIVTRLDEMRN